MTAEQDNELFHQTDIESDVSDSSGDDQKPEEAKDKASHQTEMENNMETADDSRKVTGNPGRESLKTSDYTRLTSRVLTIDEHISVETDLEKAKNDYLDLLESQKSGRILSGTIQGVERGENVQGISYAVIYHGDYKVIIPADETVTPPEDLRGQRLEDVMHYLITKRLGAEIDYIVKGIDNEAGVAVGTRLEAMRTKRKEYYFGTDRNGNNIIYSGINAEARVVSVIRAGIFVDLFGVDAVRYFVLHEMPFDNDGTITWELMVERYNSDLANTLGNLVSRTIAMTNKYFGGVVENKGAAEAVDEDLKKVVTGCYDIVESKMNELRVADSLTEIFALFKRCNKYIDETEPWVLAKDEAKKDRLATVLYNLTESIVIGASLLAPFMPETAINTKPAIMTARLMQRNTKNFSTILNFLSLKERSIIVLPSF